MKNLIALTLSLCLLTGCKLVPKTVEFFQRKVKPVPVLNDDALERQRQAADFVAKKTEAVKVAAIGTQADVTVIVPATEAAITSQALSSSVGPPESPWPDSADLLAQKLQTDRAKHEQNLTTYAKRTQADVGKKIEGTGFFRLGYFSYIGLIVGLVLLAGLALKLYGMVNPVVGAATGTIQRMGARLVGRGFTELVEGGEKFKEYLEQSPLTHDVKVTIQDLFTRAHKETQSRDVQIAVAKAV